MQPLTAFPFVLLSSVALAAQVRLPHLFPRGARAPGIEDTRFVPGQNAYLFTLRDLGGKAVVEYRLPLSHPTLRRGVLRVEETTTGVVVMNGGGLSYRTLNPPQAGVGRLISPYDLAFSAQHDPKHSGTLLAHSLDPSTGSVSLRFRDEYRTSSGTIRTEKTFRLRLSGESLELRARADESLRRLAAYDYAGFVFGPGSGLRAPARALHIPYMDMVPVFAGTGGVFVTRFLDFYQSHGSDTPSVKPGTSGGTFFGETSSAVYRNDANEQNAPVRDVAWITVSRAIEDTFPVVDRPPSPYRLLCAERAVSQNAATNRYDRAAAWVRRASSLGVDDMVQIKWGWHKWPLNLNDPDYFRPPPAIPAGVLWGTDRDWVDYAGAAAAANWGLLLYFSVDLMDPGYPNLRLLLPGSVAGSVVLTPNPKYDAARCTRDAAGNLKKGWDTNRNLARTNLRGRGHRVDVIGPHLYAAHLAAYGQRLQGPNSFPVGGLHIDAQTSIPAWIQIDQRKGSRFAHTIAEALACRDASFLAGKDGLGGPLLGENSHWRYRAFESYAAGLLDGTSRKFPIHWNPADGPPNATNWDGPVIPDFELHEVVTKGTAFFGMGWESHYKGTRFPVPDAWIDGWQTTLLSYGHAPYFGTNGDVPNNYWDWQGTLRSYHLLHGVSKAMRSSQVTAVRYADGKGRELGLGEAVARNLDLRHPRLVLRFANGLELRANHSAATWATKVLGKPFTLPPDGFAAARPDGLLALSAINPSSGARVDYAREPGVVEVIDRRGVKQSFAGFPGSLLPIPPGLFRPPIQELDLLVVKDLRRNQVVYAQDFQTAAKALGPRPTLRRLRIEADDTTTLSLGRLRIGLRAVATDSNGNDRDLTGVVRWSSTAPGVATVTRMGGVAATGPGRATIRARHPTGLGASRDVTVTAQPVVSRVTADAVGTMKALVSFTTDSHATVAGAVYWKTGSSAWQVALARSGPSGKHHRVALTGLAPATTYRVLPVAMNDFLLVGTGAAATLRTN